MKTVLVGIVEQGAEKIVAASAADRKAIKQRVHDENLPGIHDVEKALAETKKMMGELKEFMKVMEEEVGPSLAGFWVGMEKDLGGALSLALLKWAEPQVNKAGKLFGQIVSEGRSVAGNLKQTSGALVGSKGFVLPEGKEAKEVVMTADGAVMLKARKEGGKAMSVRLKNVDMKKRAGIFRIGEGKEVVEVLEGESQRFDVDGDGVEDIEVKVKKVSELEGVVAEVRRVN